MPLPLYFLLPAKKGVPVLMYHKVCDTGADRLTVSPDILRQHFTYLRDNGFRSLSLQEFLDMASGKIPADYRAFLLTFDDGYLNNFTLAYPLICSFGFKAVFFIIGNSLAPTAPAPAAGPDQKLSLADLRMLDPEIIQLALHSYHHIDFSSASLPAIQSDLEKNIEIARSSGLVFHKVLAYPYGARPHTAAAYRKLSLWMKDKGITAAFRIGNQPQKLPAPDMFAINRIDIWGTDRVREFSVKMKKGKLKPF